MSHPTCSSNEQLSHQCLQVQSQPADTEAQQQARNLISDLLSYLTGASVVRCQESNKAAEVRCSQYSLVLPEIADVRGLKQSCRALE